MIRRRFFVVLIFLFAAFAPMLAEAQYATQPGYTAGTAGGSCNTTTQAFAWPDSNGHVLQCVSGVWIVVSDSIWSVSGSSIYYTGGNVGIGTAAPGATMDISGAASTKGLRVTTSTTGGQDVFEANGQYGGLIVANNGAVSMTTGCNGVGISESCVGELELGASNASRPSLYLHNEYNYSYPLIQWNGSSPGVIAGSGSVGIGTTAPGAKLQIYPNANSTKGVIIQGDGNQSADIQEWQNSAGTTLTKIDSNGYMTFSNAAAGSFSVNIPGSSSYAISAPGYSTIGGVAFNSSGSGGGIGGITSLNFSNSSSLTPGDPSSFVGSYRFSIINNSGWTAPLQVEAIASQTANLQEWQNSGGVALDVVTVAGNVGIGTTVPASTLQVAGGFVRITDGPAELDLISNNDSYSGSGGAAYVQTSNNYPMILAANNSNAIFIAPSGKVGIGNNNPQYTLDVGTIGNSAASYISFASNTFWNTNGVFFNSNGADYGGIEEVAGTDSNGTWALGYAGSISAITPALTWTGHGNVGIGNTSPSYVLDVTGQARFTGGYTTSDERWKANVKPVADSLATLGKIKGVSFEWKRKEFPNMRFPEGKQIGFIAQDVEKVLPEIVSTDRDGYKSVSYESFAPLLVEAVKELKAANDNEAAEIAELRREIAELKKQVQAR